MAVTPASARSLRSRPSSSEVLLSIRIGARQHRRGDHDGSRLAGHLGGGDPAGQPGDRPCLARTGRQRPQRGRTGSRAVLLSLVRVWVWPLGGEKQRPVRQEARAGLALRGPGQPPGLASVRVDPPHAGQVLLAVSAQGLDGRRQPASVRREPQRADPGYRHEVTQVMEFCRGPAPGRPVSAHIHSRLCVDKPQFATYPGTRYVTPTRRRADAYGIQADGTTMCLTSAM